MKKTLLRVLSVICLLCCITGIGFATQNNAQADTVPTVTLQNGAWVRLSTVNAGIRFVAEIDDYSEDYTYGMYIFPTEYLDDYVSGDVVAHAKSKLAEGKKLAGGDCTPYFNEDEGGYRINGVLVNLHYGNLNREFVAVAYVRSGDNYTYSDVSVSRNIVWVSGASVASGKYDGQTTSLSILNNFIKLGSYQAIGASEETAEAAETLPEISVESSITVYAGLWAQPTFMYNGNPITNVFNPYVTEKDEHLSYSNHLVKGFEAGEFTVSYGDIGDCTVTVRDLDTTLNDDYYGVYSTVERITQVVTDDSPITVAEAQNAEVTLVKGTAHRGLAAGTEYDVSESGISIGGEIIETQYGVQPLNVYVLNGDAAYIYDTVYIKDYFADNTAYTSVFQYITPSGLSRDFTGDKMDIILKSNGTISGRYYATGLDIDYLKLAYVSGYDVLEFDITVDDDFAAFDGKGIRIYASRQTTGYDVGAIQAGTSGVTLYQDFGTGVTEATTFTVKIYLKEFLALDASANQLRFVISAPSGNEVYFSNFHVKMLGVEESFTKEYGFNLANSGAGGKWNTTTGGVITREYDAEKDAMKVTMLNAGAAINGRYFVLYTPIAMITEAKELGFNQVSFKVSSDNGAFTDAGRGIRIYSKANSGADGGAIDGQGTTSGVYVYGDYGTTAGTTEFTVTIDINTFIALNPNAGYIGIVMNIPQNTTAYFSDLTVSHYTAEEAFTAQYGFNSVNSKTTANGGKWDFAANGIMGISYNAAKGAMAVNMVNASAAINGRYFVMYTDISMLTDAKAAGFNTISFKVSSDNSAFTADGRGIRVFSKTNSGMDNSSIPGATGVYVYGDYGTAADTTEFTVIIDIDNFLALNENANYLGIVMNIPANTTAYFSDLTVKYTDDIEKAYGFNQTNSQTTANGGKWDVAAGGIMGKSYNAAKYAMAVNMLNANATINGRNFVMYTDISMLTDARAAGFKAISFKVWSDDGAFTADGRGIRVFSKKNSGLDGYAIATYSTAGIYVYGDYGTAASTTEFTVVIDIDDFLTKSAAYTPNYLGIVMNIPQSTTAYFSDFTAIPYTAEEVNANYGFNSANSGKWASVAAAAIGTEWDAMSGAMKVTAKNAYDVNSRYPVIETSVSVLKEAQKAGFSTVSFKVWSDDGAFTDEGKIIRVFGKNYSGVGSYNITTDADHGIYVYGDYGSAAGTTEFTVVIDLDEFFDGCGYYSITPTYLGIAAYIPANTHAYFACMTFDGEWQTSVVIPDDYSVAERNIAEKLSETLTTALGRNVIIETESEAAANERIYLGDTDAFSALGISDFDEEHLNGDGFVIASAGNNIYIAGAIDKGTVNGVYHYLEELIGVKYYGLDAVEVPSVKNLAYPVTTITEVPDFKYRAVITDSTMHTDEAEKIYSGDVAEYYAETRQSHELSHAEDVIDTFYGGSVNLFKGINQSHNNLTYVNPTTYLGTYPSMFYVVDEKAVDICYSSGINADGTIASGTNAASVYVESLKAYITANPNVEYFMLGQEDVKTRCTCSACYTGANLYGYSADNGYAAVVLRFYNAVANEIYAWETANSRDHVKLVVFSYLFSSKAPVKSSGGSYTCHSTVALASNIVLRFADFTANQYYSFVDANQSNGYGSDYLTKWACIIGDNDVWYWGYATNHSYYFAYTPSLQKISATLTALKGIDAEYVLIQHDSYEKNDWRAQMEAYVINKMLWDRTLTATTLRDEYIDGYYGVASAKIKTFVNNFDTRMATIAGNASTREYFLYDIISVSDDTYKVEELVTKDFLLSQLAVLDEAIAAIEASELSDDEKNVLIARVNAVKVTPLFYLAYAADGYYNNSSDRTTVRSTFISLCESLGITCYGEQRYIVNLKTEWGL